jgi:tetratricopeptide (TPR) repeat protein
MGRYGTRADLIVHEEEPFNAETGLAALAEGSLTATDTFYVRGHGAVPEANPATWRLRVDGTVERALDLSLGTLREAFRETEVTATLQCAGNRRAGLVAIREIPGEAPVGPRRHRHGDVDRRGARRRPRAGGATARGRGCRLRGRRVRRVELAPLTRDELAAALGDILRAPPELVERLDARSEGNPLFMEELLAAGLDGRGALPPTLRDALMLRIDRLPNAAQELLRVLAVGGRVDHELLAEAGGLDARELRESLREAAAGHLVVVDADGGHAFRHALLREVVQDDLLPGEAMELHRAFARALERRTAAGRTSAAVSAAIASHHLAAGDRPAALAASVRAAAAADAARAPGEAAALLERALDLWTRVPDPESLAGVDHVDLLWRAAEMHNLGGHRGRSEALLRRALQEVDTAAEPRRAARLMARLARVQWYRNRAEDALDTLRAGDRLLAPGEDSPERAALLAMWARVRMLQGCLREAVERARQARRVAEACGDTASLGVALNVLGTSLIPLGEIEEGEAALRRACDIAVERHDPLEIDAAACNLADALHAAGRSQEALQVARRGAEQLAASPNTTSGSAS